MDTWYTVDELVKLKLESLPMERSAISRRANKEGWDKRRRATGKKGVLFEYKLPAQYFNNTLSETQPVDHGNEYQEVWHQVFQALTPDEQQKIIYQVHREGVKSLFYNEISLAAQKLAELILDLNDEDRREILHSIETKKWDRILNARKKTA